MFGKILLQATQFERTDLLVHEVYGLSVQSLQGHYASTQIRALEMTAISAVSHPKYIFVTAIVVNNILLTQHSHSEKPLPPQPHSVAALKQARKLTLNGVPKKSVL
jgi:hypothetical protein